LLYPFCGAALWLPYRTTEAVGILYLYEWFCSSGKSLLAVLPPLLVPRHIVFGYQFLTEILSHLEHLQQTLQKADQSM
jgi:hypothetical protein